MDIKETIQDVVEDVKDTVMEKVEEVKDDVMEKISGGGLNINSTEEEKKEDPSKDITLGFIKK